MKVWYEVQYFIPNEMFSYERILLEIFSNIGLENDEVFSECKVFPNYEVKR